MSDLEKRTFFTCRAFSRPRLSARTRWRSACKYNRCLRINEVLVHAHPAHHANTRTPIFVDVEPVDLQFTRDAPGERSKRRMDSKCRRDQIHQRRLVPDFSVTKQSCFGDMTSAAVRLNAPPVVSSLQHMFTIF